MEHHKTLDFRKPLRFNQGGESPPSLEWGLGLFDKGYRLVVLVEHHVDTDDPHTTEANA